jgi:hypothetical protein
MSAAATQIARNHFQAGGPTIEESNTMDIEA